MAAKVILFDLGGVLVDLGNPVDAIGLSMQSDEFWQLWLSSPIVRDFETGQITTADFLTRFGKVLGFDGAADFERRFGRWELPLFTGSEALLRELGDAAQVALLSNTNALHWQHVLSRTDVFSRFAKLFLSYETGHMKPGVMAFNDVIEYFDCAPQEVLFMDDNAGNIAAASDFGFMAHRTVGIEAARRVLSTCRA